MNSVSAGAPAGLGNTGRVRGGAVSKTPHRPAPNTCRARGPKVSATTKEHL